VKGKGQMPQDEEPRKFNDLCSTCSLGPACAYRQASARPVWYCNEYEHTVPAFMSRADTRKSQKRSSDNPAPKQSLADGQFKGLCQNCENRETCLLPKPEGGVWHCEEYR